MRSLLVLAAAAVVAAGGSGCTSMHAYRLDRLTDPVLVTSSSLSTDAYTPIAFLKILRWRFDPGSLFRRDYESPVGFQVLNDFMVKKAIALGADAIVDVRTGYGGGLLFAHAWMEGMAVKREIESVAPAHPMPPLEVPPGAAPGPVSGAGAGAGAGGGALPDAPGALPAFVYDI